MSKEDIIKCFLDCKGEDNGFQLTLTNKDIDVIADEIERLNNIIKRLETDLYNMYITFGEFSEEYAEKCIKELKGSNDNGNL